jgi:hypothetical protein
MEAKTAEELTDECATIAATGLATPARRLAADDVVTWVERHPNSAFHELIDWTPRGDKAATAEYRRGQMIALLDRVMHER